MYQVVSVNYLACLKESTKANFVRLTVLTKGATSRRGGGGGGVEPDPTRRWVGLGLMFSWFRLENTNPNLILVGLGLRSWATHPNLNLTIYIYLKIGKALNFTNIII